MSDICWVRVIAGDLIGFLYASFYTGSVSNRQNSGEGIGKFLACDAFSSTALLAPNIHMLDNVVLFAMIWVMN